MENIKVIYLAGPLRGGMFSKRKNMKNAKRVAELLWRNHIAVISPHMNSGWLDTPGTDEFVIPANIELMLRCDAVILLDGWENSKGTALEIEVALEKGLPLYFNVDVAIHCIQTNTIHPFSKTAKEVITHFRKTGKLPW